MLVVVVFAIGHLIWYWSHYLVWFHLLVGAAYSFHVLLTWHILQTRQSDITSQGWLFSAVIIFIGNVSVLLLGIPLLTARVNLTEVGSWCVQSTMMVLRWLAALF